MVNIRVYTSCVNGVTREFLFSWALTNHEGVVLQEAGVSYPTAQAARHAAHDWVAAIQDIVKDAVIISEGVPKEE